MERYFWGIVICVVICGVIVVHTLEKVLKVLERISGSLHEFHDEARRK